MAFRRPVRPWSTSRTARSSGYMSTTSPSTSARASAAATSETLDIRAGVLRRRSEWVSPAGQAIRVSSVRLVSFVQRAIAAVCYEVEPLGSAARLVVQSELITNEPLPPAANEVPVGPGSVPSLRSEQCSSLDSRVVLVHSTRSSGLRMAAGMDHVVEGPPGTAVRTTEQLDDLGRVTITATQSRASDCA